MKYIIDGNAEKEAIKKILLDNPTVPLELIAKQLKIGRHTLYRRMKYYDIQIKRTVGRPMKPINLKLSTPL